MATEIAPADSQLGVHELGARANLKPIPERGEGDRLGAANNRLWKRFLADFIADYANSSDIMRSGRRVAECLNGWRIGAIAISI
jgi:hypothetical protein